MGAQPLDALKKDLDRAIKAGDPDKIAAAWQALANSYPDTPDGGDASYRLGLDALFRGKSLDKAAELFRVALKSKGTHALSARSSLGLVLMRQGKHQQGVFELRKVAGTTPPTIFSISAWGLLVVAFKELGNMKEAERAHVEHKRALEKMTASKVAEDAALAHYMLAMEYKIDGERAIAKRHLEAALATKALPKAELASATAVLAEL
jgi:tetratricopeptide (TPR) repeat protein